MKPAYALFACSVLGAAYFTACGSSDGKKVVDQGDAGAGGQGGDASSPAAGEGGAGGVPSAPPPGGMGGETAVAGQGGEAGSGGEAGNAGEAGAGGQAPECFEQVDANAAAAGGDGGAGGASFVPALHFSCRDLTGYYDVASRKIVIDSLPGMELMVSGQFGARYDYTVDTVGFSACVDGTVAHTGESLELSADYVAAPTYVRFPTLELEDACGTKVQMDPGTELDGFCWGIRAFPSDDPNTWAIDCYEGYGSDCSLSCPLE